MYSGSEMEREARRSSSMYMLPLLSDAGATGPPLLPQAGPPGDAAAQLWQSRTPPRRPPEMSDAGTPAVGSPPPFDSPPAFGSPAASPEARQQAAAASPVAAGAEEGPAPRLQREPSTLREWVDEEKPWERPVFRRLQNCISLQPCCKWLAYLLDSLWALGARCVVADLAFAYTWSSFLTCACFLSVAVYMMEYAFDSVLEDLPSCGRCSQARIMTSCAYRPLNSPPQQCQLKPETVPLDPSGEVAMTFDAYGWQMLLTVTLVSLANSRYLKCGRCRESRLDFSLLFLPVAFVYCYFYVSFGVWDFFGSCLDTFPAVDWQPYAPPGVTKWSGPVGPARNIAEYCRVLPGGASQRLTAHETQALEVASAVKNAWAAWMADASFWVPLAFCGSLFEYCQLVGRPVPGCIAWLNSSALGNSLKCPLDLDPVFVLAGCSANQPMVPMDCSALISGRSFAMRHELLSKEQSGAVAFHLLSLVTQGLACPRSWSTDDAQGSLQVDGSPGTCRYDPRLLQLQGGSRLVPLSWTGEFLAPEFFRCVVEDVASCSVLKRGASRTAFRSFGATACSVCLMVGLIWLAVLRALSWLREHHQRGPGVEFGRHARAYLASRILWGYVLVVLLQAGFYWTSRQVLWAYHVDVWWIWLGFDLQVLVVMAAVASNVVRYLDLRRQVLALPGEVLFGSQPAPAGYRGPDLESLKEMGTSSILYAMYFPGLVFWRFFFASWILVSLAVALLWLFAQVLQPKEMRWEHADKLFHFFCAMIFAGSVAFAHYLTRIFMQTCLLQEHHNGIRVRCLCLFSWWELMTCFLGLALSPASVLGDFLKGFITTAIASLHVDRPNFTQFGELSDYVFCTYCASLYMERMAEDLRKVPAKSEEQELEGHAEYVVTDAYDADFGQAGHFYLEEPAYRYHCPLRCSCFLLLFVGVPLLAALFLDLLRAHYDYPCIGNSSVLPCWAWDTL